jgi:mono/diheme cytochrome c family protein
MILQHTGPRRRALVAVAFLALALWITHASGFAADRPPALDDLSLRLDVPAGSPEGNTLRAWMVMGAPDAVVRGAESYERHCSVCHGDTGLGYAEAKLAFPADHRACTHCHRPDNERVMSWDVINVRGHNLFDVGHPPALRGPGALVAFADDAVLLAYTRATMPRYQPGRLSEAEYADLVAFMRWIGMPR